MKATLMAHSQSPALATYQDPDVMMLKGEFAMHPWFSDEATRECHEWHAKLYPKRKDDPNCEAVPKHEDVPQNMPPLSDSKYPTPNTSTPATPRSSYDSSMGGLGHPLNSSEISAAFSRKGCPQASTDDLLFAHGFSQLDINGHKDQSKQMPIMVDRTYGEGPTGVVIFHDKGVDIESHDNASPIVQGNPKQFEFSVGLSEFIDYVNEIGPAVDETMIPLAVLEQDCFVPHEWNDDDSDLLEAICNGIPEKDSEFKMCDSWTYTSWELRRN